jgi:hypothetical protein
VFAGAVVAAAAPYVAANTLQFARACLLACSLQTGSFADFAVADYEPELQMVEQMRSYEEAAEGMEEEGEATNGVQVQTP